MPFRYLQASRSFHPLCRYKFAVQNIFARYLYFCVQNEFILSYNVLGQGAIPFLLILLSFHLGKNAATKVLSIQIILFGKLNRALISVFLFKIRKQPLTLPRFCQIFTYFIQFCGIFQWTDGKRDELQIEIPVCNASIPFRLCR